MKYIISGLVLVGSLVLFTSNVQAQDASTTQISSFAEVTSDFAVEARRDLNFGFILAQNDRVEITPASDNAGQFFIVSSEDLDISITATELFRDGGDDGTEDTETTIPFTHFQSVRLVDEASGNFVDVGGTLEGSDEETLKIDTTNIEIAGADLGNRFDMFVGGSIETDGEEERQAGVYEGTVTVVLDTTTD